MTKSFQQTPNGLVLIADGLNPWLRWDGISGTTTEAGLLAPASAPTIASTGHGTIIGQYSAYVRFLDSYGNPSNLSPISNVLSALGSLSGNVTAATNATPIQITSAAHGLATGDIVVIVGVGGNTAANGQFIITKIDANNFTLNNSSGNGAYTSGGTWTCGAGTIAYTAVPLPTTSKTTRRQLLRSTAGEATTYYVDVDTTDLTSTSFNSTLNDSTLAGGTAVPILDANGNIFANAHGVPPDWKACIAMQLGRGFAAVEVDITDGSIAVTNGSTSVVGTGTSWTTNLAGRLLYVTGATQRYTIASVNATTQTLTLAVVYADTTNLFAAYAIRPPQGERRLIYYTPAGEMESWPPTFALSLQEDNDDLTGLMNMGSFVYFLERAHIYRYTFQTDPATDGYAFPSTSSRGCVNNRCWQIVEGQAYMLDEQGIHAFSGAQASEPISEPIQRIFRPGESDQLSINWSARKHFHSCHYPNQETIRWFVTCDNGYLPRHALAYHYRFQAWWLEEYPVPISASVAGRLHGPQVWLGSEANRVLAFWHGPLDGPDPSAGTVRGTATSAGARTLTDSTATFASTGLVNAPLRIVAGRGVGQWRQINAVNNGTLTLDEPWLIQPDATSVYQIGGVSWTYRTKTFRYVDDERSNSRRLELLFQATVHPSTLVMRLYPELSDTPIVWKANYTSSAASGVSFTAGSPDITVDSTKPSGFVQARTDGHRELYVDGLRFITLEIAGVTNAEPQTVYQVAMDGVRGD